MSVRYGLCPDHEPVVLPDGKALATCRCNPIGGEAEQTGDVDRLRAENARLRDAIRTHRNAMLSSDPIVDGFRYDEELWAVLDDGGDR